MPLQTKKIVDALDSLPAVMEKLRARQVSTGENPTASPSRRFSCVGGINESLNMCAVIEQHANASTSSVKPKSSTPMTMDSQLSQQASKVIQKLSKLAQRERIEKKESRPAQEVAAVVHQKLCKFAGGENSLSKMFTQYDPHRWGKVSYDHFRDSLNISSSGVSDPEMNALLSQIDPYKTGMIDYTRIAHSLKKVGGSPAVETSRGPIAVSDALTIDEASSTTVHTRTSPATSTKSIKSGVYSTRETRVSENVWEALHGYGSADHKGKHAHRSMSAPPGLRAMSLTQYNKSFTGKQKASAPTKSGLGVESPLRDAILSSSESKMVDHDSESPQTDISPERKSSLQTANSAVFENSFCIQLGGRLNTLKHQLQKSDVSKSGVVNEDEFKTALSKVGIFGTSKQVSSLFHSYADQISDKTAIGLSLGKGLHVDSFLQTLRSRISSVAFSHLATDTRPDRAKSQEELRIIKKVLAATGPQESSHVLFTELDPDNKGWIDYKRLKEGLNCLGANISDVEFQTIVDKVDKEKTGRVTIDSFDNALHNEVKRHTRNSVREKLDMIERHPRCNDSLRSTDILYHNYQDTYDMFSRAKDHTKEKFRWQKIRSVLQKNKDEVLLAFGGQKSVTNSAIINKQRPRSIFLHKPQITLPNGPEERSPAELIKILSKAGVSFGKEDLNRLTRNINMEIFEKNKSYGFPEKISLSDFCSLVGITVHEDPQGKTWASSTRMEPLSESSVFESSKHSALCRPNFATTYASESEKYTPGFSKKRVSQSTLAHYYEPSKFWELEHGSAAIYPSDTQSSSRGREVSRATSGEQKRRCGSVPIINDAAMQRWATPSLYEFLAGSSRASDDTASNRISCLAQRKHFPDLQTGGEISQGLIPSPTQTAKSVRRQAALPPWDTPWRTPNPSPKAGVRGGPPFATDF